MPITQDRMIALIEAGRDYKQALSRVTNAISANVQRAHDGLVTPAAALAELATYEQIILLLNDPLNSASILEIEAAYFKRNARRNAAAAKWQAEDRALKAQGIVPARKSYRPDTGQATGRPAAPNHSGQEHGLIHEILPGERPDLDAEVARAAEALGLVEGEEGQDVG